MSRTFIRGAVVSALLTSLVAAGPGSAGAFELENRAHTRPGTVLVRVGHPMPILRWPGSGRVLGRMPATSRYYHQRIVAWVIRVAGDGAFGQVPVPYSGGNRTGWIDLRGLRRSRTGVRAEADLSRHVLVVRRRGSVVLRVPAATGAPSSPTPPGRYFVTDRTPFPSGGPYGSFAFGISGIQTHLPAGWSGGDQLAIHGTNDPASIGTSSSAGCLRVSEGALKRLKRLLWPGTPVVIRA